jgi:O-antigen/teichoic acid export membrane protein
VTARGVETRTARVALVTGLATILSVALQLVSVPLYLRFWGNEKYGLWLGLLALFNLLRTFDTGFTAYVGNELNLLYHKDQAALRRTLASGVAGAVVVGALQLTAAGLIVATGTLGGLLGVPENVALHGRAGLAILLVGWAFVGPYMGIVHRLLVPAGMLYEATWWSMGVQVTQTSALVAAAILGLSITGAALLFSVTLLGIYLASALYIAHVLPEYFPWWRRPSWLYGLRDFLRSTVMVGANFLSQAGTNGLVMLVSSGLGAAAVPAFTTVRTLANLWTTLGNVLTSPLLPEVVRYHAQGDGKKLKTAYQAHLVIATVAVNLSVLAAHPVLGVLYRSWTGGRVALDKPLLSWLLLAIVVSTQAVFVTNYLIGINQLRSVTLIFAARGLLPLGLGIALLPSFGLAALGAALVVGEASALCLGIVLFRQQLHRLGVASAGRTWPTALGTLAVATFLVLHATGGPHADAAYAPALAAVLASSFWSWRQLDPEVHERARRLLRREPG